MVCFPLFPTNPQQITVGQTAWPWEIKTPLYFMSIFIHLQMVCSVFEGNSPLYHSLHHARIHNTEHVPGNAPRAPAGLPQAPSALNTRVKTNHSGPIYLRKAGTAQKHQVKADLQLIRIAKEAYILFDFFWKSKRNNESTEGLWLQRKKKNK